VAKIVYENEGLTHLDGIPNEKKLGNARRQKKTRAETPNKKKISNRNVIRTIRKREGEGKRRKKMKNRNLRRGSASYVTWVRMFWYYGYPWMVIYPYHNLDISIYGLFMLFTFMIIINDWFYFIYCSHVKHGSKWIGYQYKD
jgi:hypothetical protein